MQQLPTLWNTYDISGHKIATFSISMDDQLANIFRGIVTTRDHK